MHNNVDTIPFDSFQDAATAVLGQLHETLGFDLWMVTRTEGDDWIVLQADDRGYGVQQGDAFRWNDSFCSRMVQGMGPRIAPCSDQIAAYASAPIGRQVPIGAYVGVPLSWRDGSLFGTLCAIHPYPRPEWIVDKLETVELFARLLSSILQSEIEASEQARSAERSRVQAMTDSLTGLYNRRGWDQLIAAEAARCRRHGHRAHMISIDIDHLKVVNDTQGHAKGDELICRAADAIASTVRAQDVVARLGGDEFAVLAVDYDESGSLDLMTRLESALLRHGVQGSLGYAMCRPGKPFSETWDLADRKMYANKRKRTVSPQPIFALACDACGSSRVDR